MAKYIDKDALVAEIERRISDNKKEIERASHKNLEDYFEGYEDALALLKQFLDTLEVKEITKEVDMAKFCTTIEQSKKLTELGLSRETSDMFYWCGTDLRIGGYKAQDKDYDIPCWSLAALLDILHDYTLQNNSDGSIFVVCDSKKPMISDSYKNPIDACVEMIIHLNKQNML